MPDPAIAFIVAVSENGVIGRNGELPWRLKSELRMFRRLTLGKPVIMGRKTFESLGKPLDGRTNIVVSRSGFLADGVSAFSSVDEAIDFGLRRAEAAGQPEIFVIGGAEIFTSAMSRASRVYLTQVHAVVEGDVFLAPLDPKLWREVSSQFHARREGDDHDYTAKIFECIL
ncbi:MAG: dihydrofolate reductase [Hyphomicrobiales bacterium]|nr:dihydrofolate reductase [Hyphomicrobiales bacterium]